MLKVKDCMERAHLAVSCLIIREDEGFSSLCLDLDVASEGKTAEEAKKNLEEAITLYVETAIESNLPIIRPVPPDENPLKADPQSVLEQFIISVNIQVQAHAEVAGR